MKLHRQPNWKRVLGQHVEIRKWGKCLRTGVVDAVMPDGSILWLAAEGPWPREMVDKSEGKEVFARYSWDVGLPQPADTSTNAKDKKE